MHHLNKKAFFTIAVILWMILIFWFSAQPADGSDKMSLSVGGAIGRIFVSDFDNWTSEEQMEFAERINYPVRKMAHMTEYAVFTMLLMGMYGAYKKSSKRQIIYSLLSAMAYVATDEIHQLFVVGRSGQV